MKCKKLIIETDGTTKGTIVKVDGEVLPLIQRIEFSANVVETFIKVLLDKALIDTDGKLKIREIKTRDLNTERFKEAKKIITEPVLIEFNK